MRFCMICFCGVLGLAGGGCGQGGPAHPKVTGYFQTPFQDESQFIVETIATDLAEQIYFAKFHRLPDAKYFYVSATEAANSPFGAPVYDLEIDLDAKHCGLKAKLDVNGAIWSPEVYQDLTATLARSVGLAAGANGSEGEPRLIEKLTDGLATTIEEENEQVSKALADDFTNPALHEKAALILAAFTLREHSGDFYEIRSPLCRITSHLAMARYLGGDTPGLNGRMAGAMLQMLMNNQTEALAELRGLPTNQAPVLAWSRALTAEITGDYRPLEKLDGLSQVECIGWYAALNHSANSDIAWDKLSNSQKGVVDFARIAGEQGYSVELGHVLLEYWMRMEFQELGSVYELSHGRKIKKGEVIDALNEMPDRCFSGGANPEVHVIGWGLWAGFFQRHLCNAIKQDFNFMQNKWGVPDDAHVFSTNCEAFFGGLRLYPFVRRLNYVETPEYHKAVNDGYKVTVATPQLVPAECWSYLGYSLHGVNYDPHVSDWHKHNPPPGTAYNLRPRFGYSSLIGRPNANELYDQLRERAPYDMDILCNIYRLRYQKQPSFERAKELFGPILPYSDLASLYVAFAARDEPDKYEAYMLQAAAINPARYFELADYLMKQSDDDKTAKMIEKGKSLDPDSVYASHYSGWLIKYYMKKGKMEEARKEADFAGEVYSYNGLFAKAEFLESTGDYDGAFEWYSNIDERYNDSAPLTAFCARYKSRTNDTQFDVAIQKHFAKLFPGGMEKVSVKDFSAPPTDGAVFNEASELLIRAGLNVGDVAVAVYGIRVHTFAQYSYERDLGNNPEELDIIVWKMREQRYVEVKAMVPNRRFGVDMGDYRAK